MRIKYQGVTVAINDTHNPFQDQRALHEVELFVSELKPGLIVLLGDLNDFYPISKFDKNPQRASKLQSDLDSTKDMLTRIRKENPDARIIVIEGNHEDRLRRYLWSSAKELESLRALKLEKLYGLNDNGIELVPYEDGLFINDEFILTHGNTVRAHSSYTAKGMSDKHGGSGMMGHTHRGGSYYKRDRFGTFGWWENFCLCTLTPDWITNPNWQQGFSLVHFSGHRFWVEPIPIINRKFMYGGKIYSKETRLNDS